MFKSLPYKVILVLRLVGGVNAKRVCSQEARAQRRNVTVSGLLRGSCCRDSREKVRLLSTSRGSFLLVQDQRLISRARTFFETSYLKRPSQPLSSPPHLTSPPNHVSMAKFIICN